MPRLQTRDIIIYYEEAGQGDPLLLITGLGADLQGWALNAPALAKHFRVITFDNRGAGRTSAPDRPYSIEQMADDAAGLLEALGIERAHVLGLSMGGYIAQELALRHPKKVNKLILVATAPSIDGFGRAMLDALATIRRSNVSREGFVRVMAPYVYSPEFLDDPERLKRAVAVSVSNPYAQQDHAYLRQLEAIARFSAADRLKDLKNETLVLHSVDDALVPIRNGRRLAELIPNATLQEMPGGHIGIVEHAAAYNDAIATFLGAAVAAG